MLLTMHNTLQLLTGFCSLIKYGLSDCHGGFSTNPGFARCQDNGRYENSYGRLFYKHDVAGSAEQAADLSLLLTAGRLSEKHLATIVEACASQPDEESNIRCLQQLIITTPEFHTTNTITQDSNDRNLGVNVESRRVPYKAIIYLYLAGGVDSHNMLAP